MAADSHGRPDKDRRWQATGLPTDLLLTRLLLTGLDDGDEGPHN
jgi:hypothetical protein